MTRELIMNALNRCEPYVIPECCGGCPYEGCWGTKEECITQLHADTYALLKAQGPCLLTWDELIATDHFYIETNKDGQKYIVPGIVTIVRDTAVIASVRIGTRLIDGTIDKDVYGRECRCWTSCPTDEQREATPWNN